jgi:hypothetical protein
MFRRTVLILLMSLRYAVNDFDLLVHSVGISTTANWLGRPRGSKDTARVGGAFPK